MATEKEWVASMAPRLAEALQPQGADGFQVRVSPGKRLVYACEVRAYDQDEPRRPGVVKYETDLLVYDARDGGEWVPRVVVECKSGGVTTHDALTYSAKAATHKHVHPYLRYGVLIGDFDTTLPGRLFRHGAYFDFMMAWPKQLPSPKEWERFVAVLAEEVRASRVLQAILSESRMKARKRFQVLHRPLRLEPPE